MKTEVDKKIQRKVNALFGLMLVVGIPFIIIAYYYPTKGEIYAFGIASLIATTFFCCYQIHFRTVMPPLQSRKNEALITTVLPTQRKTPIPEMKGIPQSSKTPQTFGRQAVIARHVSLRQNIATPRKIRGLPPPTIHEKRLYNPNAPLEPEED